MTSLASLSNFPASQGPTVPPSALALGAHALKRYTFRPWGRGPAAEGRPSFTLSLWDTARPSSALGPPFIGYRLYLHEAGTRRGRVVFDRDDFVPEAGMDLNGVAIAILDAITTRPGDVAGEHTEELTPAQLDFVVRWGADLRRAARERLAWSPEQLRDLRADITTTYTVRKEGDQRHRMAQGVVVASGATYRECRERFAAAVANHISAAPEFRVGARTGTLYAFYPVGGEWVIQALYPTRAETDGGLLGESVRWPMDREGAVASLEGVLARLESQPTLPEAWRPKGRRVSARAQHGASAAPAAAPPARPRRPSARPRIGGTPGGTP